MTPDWQNISRLTPPPAGWYIYPYAPGEKQRYWDGREWKGKLRKRGDVASARQFPRWDSLDVLPPEPVSRPPEPVSQPMSPPAARTFPQPVEARAEAPPLPAVNETIREQLDREAARREGIKEEAIEELGYWNQRAAFLSHLHAEALDRVMAAEERCGLAGVTDREMQRRLEGLARPTEPFRSPGPPRTPTLVEHEAQPDPQRHDEDEDAAARETAVTNGYNSPLGSAPFEAAGSPPPTGAGSGRRSQLFETVQFLRASARAARERRAGSRR